MATMISLFSSLLSFLPFFLLSPDLPSFQELVEMVEAKQPIAQEVLVYYAGYQPNKNSDQESSHVVHLYQVSDTILAIQVFTRNKEGNEELLWTFGPNEKRIDQLVISSEPRRNPKENAYQSVEYKFLPKKIIDLSISNWAMDADRFQAIKLIDDQNFFALANREVTHEYWQISSEGTFFQPKDLRRISELLTQDRQAYLTFLREVATGISESTVGGWKSKAIGQTLFLQNCVACHKIDGRLIGSPLRGTFSEYEGREVWLFDYIKNAPQMIASGDSLALAIWEESKMNGMMAAFPLLSDEEIFAILYYCE